MMVNVPLFNINACFYLSWKPQNAHFGFTYFSPFYYFFAKDWIFMLGCLDHFMHSLIYCDFQQSKCSISLMKILLVCSILVLSCAQITKFDVFTLNKFSFPSLSPIKFQSSRTPKLSRLRKVDVNPVQTNPITTRMNLIEFLFTRMTFNYNDIVPSQKWLTFRLP